MARVLDVLPGQLLRNDFSGVTGFMLDLVNATSPLTVTGLGRFYAPNNSRVHDLNVFDAQTGNALLAVPVRVDMARCSPDLLGFCYGTFDALVLRPGKSYYVGSTETAGSDSFYEMCNPASGFVQCR